MQNYLRKLLIESEEYQKMLAEELAKLFNRQERTIMGCDNNKDRSVKSKAGKIEHARKMKIEQGITKKTGVNKHIQPVIRL